MSPYGVLLVKRLLNKNLLLKMSPKAPLQVVQDQAKTIRQTLEELKTKLRVMNDEYNEVYAQHLRDEQKKLLVAVEEAHKKLVRIETANGVRQVPLPDRNVAIFSSTPIETEAPQKPQAEALTGDNQVEQPLKEKPKKEKKEKKAKEPKKTSSEGETPIDVSRLDLRIARIEDVKKHPDADTLYVLKVDCGEEKPRTVCSGLVQQIPIEELRNRLVMLLCNLKPVKMRGITSEAMVMCACTADDVEVLIPPENSQPGDLVYCEGYTRRPDGVMNPKKKIFETVAPDLRTNDKLQACYKGVAFTVPGKGDVVAKSFKNVPVK